MNLWLYLAAINLVTFGLYWFDKRCARNQASRVPEYILLLAGFLGGTIGAILAMIRCRHKTRKIRFQLQFWALTAVQVALLIHPPMLLKKIMNQFFI